MSEEGEAQEAPGGFAMPRRADPGMEAALSRLATTEPPEHVSATQQDFSRMLVRSPATWLGALRGAAGWTVLLNVPAAVLVIVLVVLGELALLAALEAAALVLLWIGMLRRRLRGESARYSAEAFYRAYARTRGLRLDEPLRFAATHAELDLEFRPDRVLSGALPGGTEGALLVAGDGTQHGDRIAVAAGPSGPVVSASLHPSGPGLSARDLDAYAERLSAQLVQAA